MSTEGEIRHRFCQGNTYLHINILWYSHLRVRAWEKDRKRKRKREREGRGEREEGKEE